MFKIKTAGRALRATALAGALVAATLATAGNQAAVAGTVAPATSAAGPVVSASRPAVKPTIVLVHGAWADGSSWNGVISRLQRDGYTVDVPPNPLLGVSYDTATLRDFLGTIPGPVVLVGHSYGGEVITNAATGNVNVKALVYVDAYLPDEGQTLGQLASSPPRCPAAGRCAAPAGHPALTDVSGVPAWRTIPSWAVVGTADRAIPPAEQLAMARNAHARITKINAPHLSMIKKPHAVTSVILQAVHATT